MSLQEEITKKTKEFRTDSYSMSIGEIANLYKDGELIIDPEFQRFFRWSYNKSQNLLNLYCLVYPPLLFLYIKEKMVFGS